MAKRKIDSLILHHSVSTWGDGEEIKRWHCDPKPRGRGWKFPGYHCVILNGFPDYGSFSRDEFMPTMDGHVDRTLSEQQSSNGCRWANRHSLNVCLIGEFDNYKPTELQIIKTIDLLVYWCKEYKLHPMSDIYGHGEMQRKLGKEKYSKTCPGKNIDMGKIRYAVYEILKKVKT